MNIFEKRKPHKTFQRIITYAKMMHYSMDDIINMSDNELKIWYNRMLKISSDKLGYRIKMGVELNEK